LYFELKYHIFEGFEPKQYSSFLTHKLKYQLIALIVDAIGHLKNIVFLNDYCSTNPKYVQFKRTTHKFQYISHPPWPFSAIAWLHFVAILEGKTYLRVIRLLKGYGEDW